MALLTEKQKGILSSSIAKKKGHSKAFIREKPDIESDTSIDSSSESDEDLKRFADNLVFMSPKNHIKYGKKKFYAKPNSEYYKKDKYKSRKFEKKPFEKAVEKNQVR